jgi:acyl dehydratase
MKYPEILDVRPEPSFVTYDEADAVLYALSLGMGADPMDATGLSFVLEDRLRIMPTFPGILGRSSSAIIEEGQLDYSRIVHGEQRLRLRDPLPVRGRLRSQSRCLGVVDKGADKGALVNVEDHITDADTGASYATILMTLFCRGDGGFGGPTEGALPLHEIPARAPDRELALPTRPDQALLYRLNGDRNPLHADPEAAAKAGFPRPILHGLCTYGIASRAVLEAYCEFRPERIRSFDVRFSAPVFPGETIVTRLWKDDLVVSFECVVAEREATVIRNGRCELSPA